MKNKWMIAVLVLLSISVFYLSSTYSTNAQESQECPFIIFTEPGDYKNCKLYPLRFAANDPTEITCGNPETIYIEQGSPPFTWTVSGTGYTLTDVQGNERSKILNCSGSI